MLRYRPGSAAGVMKGDRSRVEVGRLDKGVNEATGETEVYSIFQTAYS